MSTDFNGDKDFDFSGMLLSSPNKFLVSKLNVYKDITFTQPNWEACYGPKLWWAEPKSHKFPKSCQHSILR